MERNTQKNGLINLLMLLIAGVAAFAAARYSNSLAGQVSVIYLGLGVLVAAVSWFQMRLEESERLEKLELDELARSHGESALFEAKEADVFPAQRSREQFERFFVPIFTVILCVLEAGGAYVLWKWLSRTTTRVELQQPTVGLFVFFLLALVLFLLGRFSATFARIENRRLLRPGASYVLLNAILSAVVGIGIVVVQFGARRADLYVAYALCGVLALVATETLVALVLEMYRPRVKGKVERPLYESRLVGLLGQPEGLITTAAQAIDYQFGFKVSETWFYKLGVQAVLWLVPLQLLILFLSTCMVIVEPGQHALLEHYGRPVEGRTVLEPGLHFKWPWPADKVYRFRTEQVQRFNVGFTPDPEREKESTVLWTVAHTKEENFLVAHRNTSIQTTPQGAAKRTPPVSLLTVSIPVQYQISDLRQWAYNNEDAPSLLQDLATREVVRYLAAANLTEIMSNRRMAASGELAQRIQAAADERGLGAHIISVGLQDIHPPVKVAQDYEKVVGAIHTKQAKILAAHADRIRSSAMAEAQATTVTNRASADRTAREMAALAQAGLFTNQIPAFQAAPAVYAQRAYLDMFSRATTNSRKYVLLTTNTHDVITFDLQESIARDILKDVSAPAVKK